MSQGVPVLRIYRKLIRSAKVYPSNNRGKIVVEIQAAFREGSVWTDPKQVKEGVRQALMGLKHLQQYSGLDAESDEWEIQT